MRLIDADKLFYEDVKCTDGYTYMVVHAPEIDNVSTAYDTKKVIEQLKKKAEYTESKAAEYEAKGDIPIMDAWDREAKAYRNAIEIVKSGGIADK